MDIRTKLVFACVVTALGSMALLAAFFYGASADLLRSLSARQLDALASVRQQDLRLIAQGWRDAVGLVQSRTKLRDQMALFPSQPDAARERIQRILDDALASTAVITRISVYGVDGQEVASAGVSEFDARPLGTFAEGDLALRDYFERSDGGIDAVFHAPLSVSGARVGSIETVVDTSDAVAITQSHQGLGETGELFLVAELTPGVVTILNRLRHQHGARLVSVPRERASEVVRWALGGGEGVNEDARDYRGERVWAATRPLPNVRGALIVKVDAAEELAPVVELRRQLVDVALSVAALAILGGAAFGLALARPIRRLHEVVERIRAGEPELRADVAGEDEVSFLAASFNELMDERQGRRPE